MITICLSSLWGEFFLFLGNFLSILICVDEALFLKENRALQMNSLYRIWLNESNRFNYLYSYSKFLKLKNKLIIYFLFKTFFFISYKIDIFYINFKIIILNLLIYNRYNAYDVTYSFLYQLVQQYYLKSNWNERCILLGVRSIHEHHVHNIPK